MISRDQFAAFWRILDRHLKRASWKQICCPISVLWRRR